MTDVPGHTRSIISYMAAQGIEYLHLGVNYASKVPNVPSLFVWRDASGAEIIVNYSDTYGDIFHYPGMQEVLYFAHTGDNNGPPSIKMIRDGFARLQEAYPGAVIKAFTMDKIGGLISPFDVVRNGNRNLHAIDTGVYYEGADGNAKIIAYDSPVLAPGKKRLLQFDNTQPSLDGGFHFLLYNNVWGTNFRMWFEEDCTFGYQLLLQSY